eukprot:scaffold615853_cov43-Prasinocladus_malaysianus.AAC.1
MHGVVPGKAILMCRGQWIEPSPTIRALAMGIDNDELDGLPDVGPALRHKLLGACTYNNICGWVALAILSASVSEVAFQVFTVF